MNKIDAIRQRNRDIYFKELFLNHQNAQEYFKRNLNFEVRLIMPKDIKKGFYSIHGARKMTNDANQYETFDDILKWLKHTSPFEYWEDGEYLNMDFEKEFYEACMNDFDIGYYERKYK